MSKRKRVIRPVSKPPSATKTQNPRDMLGQLQALQQQVLEAQEKLGQETITATAGGGVVKVTVTGDQKCTAVEIAPELLEDKDVDLLQDLLVTAINSALESSRKMAEERLGPLSAGVSGLGIDLPL